LSLTTYKQQDKLLARKKKVSTTLITGNGQGQIINKNQLFT